MPSKNPSLIPKKDAYKGNLHLPKDTKRYKARKIQYMIREIEKFPVKYNMKDYLMLLTEFASLVEDIVKDEKARRLDKKPRKAKVELGRDEADVKDKSVNVGSDVSTSDPFAG